MAENTHGVPVVQQDWMIDRSAGRPILTYQGCSVIEAEQAEYVLRLIAADGVPAAPAPGLTDAQAEALIEASDGHWKEDVFCIGGPELMALLRAAAASGVTPVEAPSSEEAMRRALGDIISQTIVTERMDYPDPQKWKENGQRIRQIARDALGAGGPEHG